MPRTVLPLNTRIMIRITRPLYERLVEIARQREMTLADVLRQALVLFAAAHSTDGSAQSNPAPTVRNHGETGREF